MSTEQLSVCIIGLVALVPILIISMVLMAGRGSSLIAGFNTMSEEEQCRWDAVAICRFLGKLLFIFTVLTGAAMACSVLGRSGWFGVIMAAAMAELLLGVLYMNKSDRFKR